MVDGAVAAQLFAGHLEPSQPDGVRQHPGVEPLPGSRRRDDVDPVTVADLNPVEAGGVHASRAELGPEVVNLHGGGDTRQPPV